MENHIDASTLSEFVSRIFSSAGASDGDAEQVADHLVTANLKGHDSHGVGMIPSYVFNIKQGLLKPTAQASVRVDKGAAVLIDGGFGFGQVIGRQAIDIAIERVRTTSVVALGVRNSHHLGRIGSYGEQAAAAGFGCISFVNVVGHEPQVSPFGGRERRMTTNPFCVALPRREQPPIVLDMATSAVALGKIRVAHMKGVDAPEGALVDHEGLPTIDPGVMYREPQGALGPFGGHKGYGLAVMCELLGGALAGQWTAQPANPRSSQIVNNMMSFLFDPDLFGDAAGFDTEMTAMADYLQGTSPAKGTDKVRLPGDPERESVARRSVEGVPIDDNSWQGIVTAARKVGVPDDAVPSRGPAR